MSIQPWPKLRSQPLGNFRVFTLRQDFKVSPRTGKEHDFFVLDCVNWVNVIALTPDRQIVMVEQFRHGSETVELEVPGGVMDRADASPLVTAARELREETGFEGDAPRLIGSVWANPAIMSNTCYTALVENCELKHSLEFDSGEDIVTRLVPLAEIPGLISSGKIRHSLVVVALQHFALLPR